MSLTSTIYLIALFVFCIYTLGYGLHQKKKQGTTVPLWGIALLCASSVALSLVEALFWMKR